MPQALHNDCAITQEEGLVSFSFKGRKHTSATYINVAFSNKKHSNSPVCQNRAIKKKKNLSEQKNFNESKMAQKSVAFRLH